MDPKKPFNGQISPSPWTWEKGRHTLRMLPFRPPPLLACPFVRKKASSSEAPSIPSREGKLFFSAPFLFSLSFSFTRRALRICRGGRQTEETLCKSLPLVFFLLVSSFFPWRPASLLRIHKHSATYSVNGCVVATKRSHCCEL